LPEINILSIKLLVDMNLAYRWAAMLSQKGIETVHWADVGAADAPDIEIMAYAASRAYTVLTNDLDFSAILAATHGSKPSVAQIRAVDTRPEAILEQVVQALIQAAPELETGALVTIAPNKTRLRILPL
jgi:predicted nuclease of predicted toxin-antitoxin system